MAWGFRRSLKLGPIRVNLSKSGVGYSVGGRGFRVGKDAKGRSYTAASIPGMGLYNRSYSSQGKAVGGSAAQAPGTATRVGNGAALAFGLLALAFGAGVLVTLMVSAALSAPPIAPPAPPPALASPVARPAAPAKRRSAHRPKQGGAQALQPQAAPQPQ